MRIQFICKKNETYGFLSYTRRSSGLYNSTRFIVEGLQARGVHAEIIEVHDNNDIDRNVTRFKPDIVIIEALWVVPEKFDVLMRLHPRVYWAVHMHSHMPFLALEGIAMDWLRRYAAKGIGIIANSPPSYRALKCVVDEQDIMYLPNVYIPVKTKAVWWESDTLNVGCFGAIRPLKNQLLQAMASIEFAKRRGKKLRFHINASRSETGGDPVLKNLVQLFEKTPHAELVQCPWMEPHEFISYLQRNINIGLQVSLTETFNVVCADYVTAGIPVVASKEVSWLSWLCKAKDDSVESIIRHMHLNLKHTWIVRWNQFLLKRHSKRAQEAWYRFVKAVEAIR